MGERLAHFKENWQRFTSDQLVLHMVGHGILIDFHTQPMLTNSLVDYQLPAEMTRRPTVFQQVEKLLEKKVIERVADKNSWGLYSRFFVVLK